MSTIFTTEEENQLHTVINDYRAIYERAAFLSIEMTKMEDEMKTLLEKMESLKSIEQQVYESATQRTGKDSLEIRKEAATLVLNKINEEGGENLAKNAETNETLMNK
jgi:hypothetical protein